MKHENENIGLARPEVEEIGPMKTGVYKTCQTMDDTQTTMLSQKSLQITDQVTKHVAKNNVTY